jgi:hypothetical protein
MSKFAVGKSWQEAATLKPSEILLQIPGNLTAPTNCDAYILTAKRRDRFKQLGQPFPSPLAQSERCEDIKAFASFPINRGRIN